MYSKTFQSGEVNHCRSCRWDVSNAPSGSQSLFISGRTGVIRNRTRRCNFKNTSLKRCQTKHRDTVDQWSVTTRARNDGDSLGHPIFHVCTCNKRKPWRRTEVPRPRAKNPYGTIRRYSKNQVSTRFTTRPIRNGLSHHRRVERGGRTVATPSLPPVALRRHLFQPPPYAPDVRVVTTWMVTFVYVIYSDRAVSVN